MGKSLTETAKAILQGQNLAEEANQALGGNPITSTGMTPNMATLRPMSKGAEGQIVNPGATSDTGNKAQDLGGATPTSTAKENLGAKAAGATKKDTSKSSQSAVPAEKVKKQAEVMEEDLEQEEADLVAESEELDEEIEISEELEAFIDQLVAEGLSEEEIAQAIEENFEFVTEEEEAAEEYQVDMSEHVNALLEGEELSEEFKQKATTIFEAAVKQKVEEEIARLEEAYAATLEEQIEEITEELSGNVDDYLNYVVETWMNDNEIAIESGLRSELTEDFISGLRNLFAENYIDIPEDKVSVVEELSAKIDELEDKLNEEIENNVVLTKMLSESKKVEALNTIVEGLTSTQAEKLKSLAEGIEFTDVEQYQEKLETLRESYFPASVKTDNVLDRAESNDGVSMITEDSRMSKYVEILGRQSK